MPSFRAWFAGPRRKPAPPAPPEQKASAARRLAALTTAGRPNWTSRDASALAREGFARNPIAYRCIRMIAEAAASIPLVVLQDGVRADASDPLAALLAKPNPEEGATDLMERFLGCLQTFGDAYIEAAGEEAAVTELYVLRPDRVRVVPGADGWPAAWIYAAGGREATIGRQADGWAPVLHLKLFNPVDDLYGLSPLQAAAFAVDVHNASSAWNKALLDNSARPSGALVYDGRNGERMGEEAFLELKRQLEELHTGSSAAGRPLLLEGGLDWKPMALSPAEMDFTEGKHSAAREIALAFGVPPQLLGIPGDATYANYKEANAAFWRLTVVPLAQRAARALSAWLEPSFPGGALVLDLDAAPALQAERADLWARLDQATFLTAEERRRMAGLPDLAPQDVSQEGPS